ncbi:MAG: hypothetical protein ACAI38_18745 [Myxococcota bacterium]
MTRIPTNAVRIGPSSSLQLGERTTRASAKTTGLDQLAAPSKTDSAARKFAELKASISADLIGHGSDGQPFFALGSFKQKRTEAELLAALASKLFSKRSEIAEQHDFLAGTSDDALRAFTARADSLREQVPEESTAAFNDAISKTQQLFFNKTLFAEVRAVETSTYGSQYGRDALTLLGRAHTGQWFYVALEIVG